MGAVLSALEHLSAYEFTTHGLLLDWWFRSFVDTWNIAQVDNAILGTNYGTINQIHTTINQLSGYLEGDCTHTSASAPAPTEEEDLGASTAPAPTKEENLDPSTPAPAPTKEENISALPVSETISLCYVPPSVVTPTPHVSRQDVPPPPPPNARRSRKARAVNQSAFRGEPRIKRGDIAFVIIGETGSGKSLLVNRLLGWDQMRVDGGLGSVTEYVHAAAVGRPPEQYEALTEALEGRQIVFFDTPGLDHTHLGDVDVWVKIIRCFEATYRRGMLLGGVLYLHDITRDGWRGNSRKNLRLFSKLCGENSLSQVSFVTTKWDRVTKQDKFRRVSELKSSCWNDTMAGGASVYHLRPPCSSTTPSSQSSVSLFQDLHDPWDIVHEIIVSMNALDIGRPILLIQDELVNRRLPLFETQLGQELHSYLQALLKHQKDLHDRSIAKGEDIDREALEKLQRKVDDSTLHKRLGRWMRRAFSLPQSGS